MKIMKLTLTEIVVLITVILFSAEIMIYKNRLHSDIVLATDNNEVMDKLEPNNNYEPSITYSKTSYIARNLTDSSLNAAFKFATELSTEIPQKEQISQGTIVKPNNNNNTTPDKDNNIDNIINEDNTEKEPDKDNEDVIEEKPTIGSIDVLSKVSFSTTHTMALSKSGNLYALGSNFSGEMGNKENKASPLFTKVNLPKDIKIVSFGCGFGTSAILDSNGDIYTWGRNDLGELGIGKETSFITNIPQKVTIPNNVKIKSMAVGTNFIAAVGEDGNIYTWGENRYGQLGNGNITTSSTNVPQKITLPNNVKAKNVYAMSICTFVIGEDDNIYAFGRNVGDELGIGIGGYDISTPKKMDLPKGVTAKSLHLQYYSPYLEGSDGNFYVWGSNSLGELGVGDFSDQTKPIVFKLPNGIKPVTISRGKNQTMAIGSDGELYICGLNQYGELGLGMANGTFQPTPKKLTLPDNAKPIYIKGGYYTSYVIGDNGKLYSWGRNTDGALGLGDKTNRNTPQEVKLKDGFKPIDIITDNASTILIDKDSNMYGAGSDVGVDLYLTGEYEYYSTTFEKVVYPAIEE